MIDSARRLVTAKNIGNSTIRLQPSSFVRPGAYAKGRTNNRERRMLITFGAANEPTLVYHNLGFVPSGVTALQVGAAATVYNDMPLQATTRAVIIKCDTAGVTADILVR